MGFVIIFWKNNVQEAYLPKMSISEQIVSEILCSENYEYRTERQKVHKTTPEDFRQILLP